MTANELLQAFLKDKLLAEKYGIKPEIAESLKFSDTNPNFFIKTLKECIRLYEEPNNSRSASNLYKFVESQVTEGDAPKQ
jgi:hypothetical protein